MKKKSLLITIISLFILLAGIGGVLYFQNIQEKKEESLKIEKQKQEEFNKYNKVLERAKITGVKDLEGEYKKVTIDNGEITFSFEVPDNWLTETRNSGEVEMNEEELREFWGTIWGGDIRAKEHCEEITSNKCLNEDCSEKTIKEEMECGKPYSDYVDLDWEHLKNLSDEGMRVSKNIPITSVSGGKEILYASGSRIAYQIDFYYLSNDDVKSEYNLYPERLTVSESMLNEWAVQDINVSGIPSLSMIFNKIHEYGYGSRRIFIPLRKDSKTLLISTSGGVEEIDTGFDYIINSLSIEE